MIRQPAELVLVSRTDVLVFVVDDIAMRGISSFSGRNYRVEGIALRLRMSLVKLVKLVKFVKFVKSVIGIFLISSKSALHHYTCKNEPFTSAFNRLNKFNSPESRSSSEFFVRKHTSNYIFF